MRWVRNFVCRLLRKPLPPLGVEGLIKAKKCMKDYEEMRARRVLPTPSLSTTPYMAAYSLQAAEVVEKEGHSRSPSLENEIRLLSLAARNIIEQLEDIHAFILTHTR